MVFSPSENDRILVVSPHPDDESIGCGGLISLYAKQCDVLLVTDGYDKKLDNKVISEVRKTEFKNAMVLAGVNNSISLHIPEHSIVAFADRFATVNYSMYNYIFVPNKHEIHKDHVDVYNAIKKAIKKTKCKAELIEYEVWTTLREPNVKLDISSVVDKKTELINVYESQTKDLDYVGMILGLNSYRGKSHGCDCAEYFYSEAEYKRQKRKKFKAKIRSFIK
ncbi:MAG: PIG-L family deacetylase [Ruminococcus sp.]|nr:PIG-L family deacetylase [Ruminococcus sp.]